MKVWKIRFPTVCISAEGSMPVCYGYLIQSQDERVNAILVFDTEAGSAVSRAVQTDLERKTQL